MAPTTGAAAHTLGVGVHLDPTTVNTLITSIFSIIGLIVRHQLQRSRDQERSKRMGQGVENNHPDVIPNEDT